MANPALVKTSNGVGLSINGVTIDPFGATNGQVLTFSGGQFVPVAGGGAALGNYSFTASTFNMPANAIFSGASSATNTTGLSITPNVVDGASSIALDINAVTALSSGLIAQIRNGGIRVGAISKALIAGVGMRIQGDNSSSYLELSSSQTYLGFGSNLLQIGPSVVSTNIPLTVGGGVTVSSNSTIGVGTTAAANTTAMTLGAAVADGASSLGVLVDVGGGLNTDGSRFLSLKNGTNTEIDFYARGGAGISGYPSINFSAAGGATASIGLQSGNQIAVQASSIYPTTSNATLGAFNTPWYKSWCYSIYEGVQTVAAAATLTLDTTTGSQGQNIVVTMGLNVTSWSITANPLGGTWGQKVTITFVQDATGSRTLAGAAANIKFLPSTYLGTNHSAPTLTTTANARDTFVFQYDGTNWVEIQRNMNN